MLCLTRCLNLNIDHLNGEIRKLGNVLADRAGPEREPGIARHSRGPGVTRSETGNCHFFKKRAVSPGPFDGKTCWGDHVVKLKIIVELNGSVSPRWPFTSLRVSQHPRRPT